MDFEYEDFVDEALLNQCDQVRNVAKKNWLTSAHVSLAHLDEIKAKVYNVGFADPKDLKATNLRNKGQRGQVNNELSSEPPLSTVSLQKTAWGSNGSLPDLVKQQGGESLKAPQRPGSAKYTNSRNRPPSGKRTRPQSAKEPLPCPDTDGRQSFGIKGSKYDQTSRPPKGVSPSSGTGWVGPPAGLKYVDKPPDTGVKEPVDSVHLSFTHAPSPALPQAPPGSPTQGEEYGREEAELYQGDQPTQGLSPMIEEQEKTKRVFELFIGNPYKSADDEDGYVDESDEEIEFNDIPETTPSSLPQRPTPESLRLSLPVTDDEVVEEDEMDTERLLEQAEMFTKKLDLKHIININKEINNDNNSMSAAPKCAEKDSCDVFDNSDNQAQQSLIPENSHLSQPDLESRPHPPEKGNVKFSEEKNLTVDITPRNIGRKVSDLNPRKKRDLSDGSFVDLIEVKNRIEPVLATGRMELSNAKQAARPPSGKSKIGSSKSAENTTHMSERTKQAKHELNQTVGAKRSVIASSEMKESNRSCPGQVRNVLANRPKSASRMTASVPLVTVAYAEDKQTKAKTDRKTDEEVIVKKKVRKPVTRDVVTLMQEMSMRDAYAGSEEKESKPGNSDKGSNSESAGAEISTEKKLSDTSIHPTVCKSEPEKNYYDISRHSSLSNIEDNAFEQNKSGEVVPVIKTTKTIVFDELKPKEMTVRSVIDPQVTQTKDKDRFLATPSGMSETNIIRRQRPQSAKTPVTKRPISNHGDNERPGSRLGFVAMTPDRPPNSMVTSQKTKRPSSAPVKPQTAPGTNSKGRDKPTRTDKTTVEAKEIKKTESASTEQLEREKVIDNLLERTRTLLEKSELTTDSKPVEKKKVRPMSAHVGTVSRTRDQKRVRSAVTRRPDSCKHLHSTGQVKKTTKRSKPVVTEPCIINTKTSFSDGETEEDLICADMEQQLADQGLNIRAETLQRALYPPTGKTKYYKLTTDLPKTSSLTLLSHPKVWLPDEYQRLRKAERTLARANEIMFLQKRAEERKARLAELGPEGPKKKKKGKKGSTKKLRRSKSFG